MEFLNPNVFYMMLIPLVLLFVLIVTAKDTVQKHFSKEIIEKLKVGDQYLSKKSRNILFFVVLLLFIIALGRPVIDKKEQNVKQSLIPLVIGLDVSTSMLAEDIYPNRISLAKKKLQQIIKTAQNTTIGIVLFAKDSFILSPVTEDFISLKFIVDNLNTNLDFVNGSNIFSTLEATKYMLADYKIKNLIILSDGGNDNNYKEELDFTKDNNIVIYSIGLGTKEGAPIPKNGSYITNNNGDIVTVKLNESIKKLSLQSGGGYIEYTLDNSDVDAIINRINIQSKKEELNIKKVKVYTELFYYPVSLGLFLLLIALSSLPTSKSKNSVKSLLWLCFITATVFIPIKSNAYTFNFENIENGKKAYISKDYKKASDEYRKVSTNNESLYNLGNSLYKQGKYNDAIDIYNQIITSDKKLESKKLHNLGNSYVNLNKLEKAKEFYEKSLKINEDTETKENLEIVNKELDKKKKQQDKKEDKQKKDKKKNQEDKKNKSNSKQDENESKNKENEKNKNKKEENKKNTDKVNKEKSDSQKSENENKEEDKKKQEDTQESGKANKAKKVELTDREEKKWMQMLKNQPTPIYMQKVQTDKESNNDAKNPW